MTLWRPFACFGQKSTCEVLRHVVQEGVPAKSMQYSYLVFSSKPGKAGSTLPKDLRKLSLLQTDHKILTGVLAARLRKTEAYTLLVHQYAARHAITQARDLISNISPNQRGCAVIQTDFIQAYVPTLLLFYTCFDLTHLFLVLTIFTARTSKVQHKWRTQDGILGWKILVGDSIAQIHSLPVHLLHLPLILLCAPGALSWPVVQKIM